MKKPAPNIRILCSWGLETLTAPGGSFLFTDLLPSQIRLYVDLQDLTSYHQAKPVPVQVRVTSGGSNDGIRIALQRR